MKLLIDFFPIILFFAAFKVWGIYTATAVAIAATVAQIAYLRLRHGKVEPMQWVSLGVIVVFGGATLLAHSETFIKWKPTVLYWVMAGGMLTATFLKKNAIRLMLQDKLELPEPAWLRLNLAWIAFLTGMGLLNLYVAFNYSTDTWVNFKLFGGMGLLLLFMLAQGVYLSRYIKEETP